MTQGQLKGQIAVLFPGHGAEFPRMGLEMARAEPRAGQLLDLAGELLGLDARALLRRGGDRLIDTRTLQPIMTAVSLGAFAALTRAGIIPRIALGHSLGEIAAWSCLGAVPDIAAIELAAVRGAALADLASTHPGVMLALPRLSESMIPEILAFGRTIGPVDPAVHNAPQRWVLAGARAPLLKIAARYGGRILETSGPWHSPPMAPSRPRFAAALARVAVNPTPGWVCNQSGALIDLEDPDTPVKNLLAQLGSPVQFAACMRTLLDLQPRALILVASGKILRGLLRENLATDTQNQESRGSPPVFVLERPQDLDPIVAKLGQ